MNRKERRQGLMSSTPQFQWRMSWERKEEAGGEVGTTMVSRFELQCGKDDVTSSASDVDRECVDVIGVDDSFVDVIGVDGSCPFKPRTHKHVYMIRP